MFIGKLITPVLFTDLDTQVEIGYLPANAIITDIKVLVGTLFNSATTAVLAVGTAADEDKFADAVDISSAGPATVSLLLAGQLQSATEPTQLFALFEETGTAATTGALYVIVEYAQL